MTSPSNPPADLPVCFTMADGHATKVFNVPAVLERVAYWLWARERSQHTKGAVTADQLREAWPFMGGAVRDRLLKDAADLARFVNKEGT